LSAGTTREFTLVAFGGGGPLHACSLARALRIPTVLVPAMPGALSAVGILLADAVRDYSRTVMLPGDAIGESRDASRSWSSAASGGVRRGGPAGRRPSAPWTCAMPTGIRTECPLGLQSPPAIEAFHRLHQQRYGFCDVLRPVEIVNLRLRMIAAGEPYAPA
jgi:N-methylhydantoinase A